MLSPPAGETKSRFFRTFVANNESVGSGHSRPFLESFEQTHPLLLESTECGNLEWPRLVQRIELKLDRQTKKNARCVFVRRNSSGARVK